MRDFPRFLVCAAVLGLLAAPALSEEAKAAKTKKAAKPAALVSMTPDQMKWESNPGDPNAKVAVAWGDMNKGPHGAFHKFPAGWSSPLHTHSADVRFAVVSGTMVEATADGKETKLPQGSYCYQPHTVKHVTKCDAGSECVIFAVVNGKFDLIPAEGAKAEAGKAEPKK